MGKRILRTNYTAKFKVEPNSKVKLDEIDA